jgi:SOS-response transcriptional repressor LexA
MSMGLTARQSELLEFIRARVAAKGVAPSFQEIGTQLNINSKSVVFGLLEQLEIRGVIRRLKGRARAIELLVAGDDEYTIRPIPEVQRGIRSYAAAQGISEKAAIEEAIANYFRPAGAL